MATPNAEATPEAVETKIEFSPEQQAKIEEIIKSVSGRVASDLRDDNKRLQRELDAAKAATPVTPDLSRDLELSRAELKALRAEQAENKLNEQLRQAAGDTFLSSLGVRLMRDAIKIGSDGKPVVIDESGNPALGPDFQPMTLPQLVEKVANEHKYLARGTVMRGAGSTPGGGPRVTTEPTLSQIFGKSSSGQLAGELMRRSPSEYRRLKNLAREKGLIQ